MFVFGFPDFEVDSTGTDKENTLTQKTLKQCIKSIISIMMITDNKSNTISVCTVVCNYSRDTQATIAQFYTQAKATFFLHKNLLYLLHRIFSM